MRNLFIILLSALSLTAVAQEKKNIVISPIQCENTMISCLVKSNLIKSFIQSEEWQPIERPSEDEINRMLLEGRKIGVLPTAQYVLSTDIQDMQGMCFISCRIMDAETAAIVSSATQMSASSPESIQQACASLANQLLDKQ